MKANPCPLEHHEQAALFREATIRARQDPFWLLLYATPNAFKRTKRQGAYMVAEGLKKGIPDICLPVARGGYNALYIELKRVRGSRTSDAQKEWRSKLQLAGNCSEICKGAQAAADLIRLYLAGKVVKPGGAE